MQTSLQYGYIRAKMIRVKMLHQFLWLQVFEGQNNNNSASTNPNDVSTILGQGKTKYPEEMTKKEADKLNELITGEKAPKPSIKNKVRKDSNALLTNLVGSAYRPTTETSLSQSNDVIQNNNNSMDLGGTAAKNGKSKKGKKSTDSASAQVPQLNESEVTGNDNTINLDDYGSFQVHDILTK